MKDLKSLLLLYRILEDKPTVLAALLRDWGSATHVFEAVSCAVPGMIDGKVVERIGTASYGTLQKQVEGDLRWLGDPDHHLIILGEPGYPELLAEIPDPPVLLFCHGKLDAFQAFRVAMVGSRNPTRTGIKHAEEFAAQLAAMGIAVTSGLALGIDAASHRGALSVNGLTIAVLGCGCDKIYPHRHRRLKDEIVERGMVISEFPLGTQAYPANFPRRNRVVTGLSLGTLVVEAQERSGSLISARLAMEQGRQVCAIPGSINSRQSRGCHGLIRDGATLVENVAQLLQEMESLAAFQIEKLKQNSAGSEEHSTGRLEVLAYLSADPVVVDTLCDLTGKDISEILVLLVELEIEGYVVSEAGGYCLV
jgi:DNA processing protein